MRLLRRCLSASWRLVSRPTEAICATRKLSEPNALAVMFSAYTPKPVDGRAHQDHAGHADDHAEQRQKAAQFVRADRIERQGDGRSEIGEEVHARDLFHLSGISGNPPAP
jgi:hypothetical protein